MRKSKGFNPLETTGQLIKKKRFLMGFTLVEALLAIIIVSGGIAAILQAYSSGLFAYHTDVENAGVALSLAQAKMEEIKNTDFASLADSGPTPDTQFPNYNTTVNVAEGQNPMRAEVTVNWNVKGGQTNVSLTTLRTNY